MVKWTRTIQEQVNILHRHTEDHVNRLVFLAVRARNMQTQHDRKPNAALQARIDKLYAQMVDIVHATSCVEETVKARWPHVTELYDEIKSLTNNAGENSDEAIDQKANQ